MEKFLIASRGMSGLAPENTLSAFALCKKKGIKWFQCDLRMLKDGTVVSSYSEHLDRCANCCGKISELEKCDLRKIDVGSWFSDDYIREKIPTLEEIIDLANEKELNIVMELKKIKEKEKFIKNILNKISNLEKNRKILISSEDYELLKKIKEISDKIEVAPIFNENLKNLEIEKILSDCKATHVQFNDKIVTRENIFYLKNKNYKIEVFCINDLIRANQLFNWGVNGVITKIAEKFPNTYKA